MDHFLCEMQIEDFLNEEEIEAVVDLAIEAANEGQKPVIKMGFSESEINGQLKFDFLENF